MLIRSKLTLILKTLLMTLLLGQLTRAEGGIQWYASWDSGLSQARKSGRPILLVAAAPHCHNISGIW